MVDAVQALELACFIDSLAFQSSARKSQGSWSLAVSGEVWVVSVAGAL